MEPDESFRLVNRYAAQDSVVERLRSELEARAWSQSELSRQLAALKPPYHLSQGAISRMLAYETPREITVDDLLAFVRALGIPLDEFVLPAAVTDDVGGWGAYMAAVERLERLREAVNDYEDALTKARAMMDSKPGLKPRIEWHRERLLDSTGSDKEMPVELEAAHDLLADEPIRFERAPGPPVPRNWS